MTCLPRSVARCFARRSRWPVAQCVARIFGLFWGFEERPPMRVAYAIVSSFAALILVGGFLASCALLNAQIATRRAHQVRHRSALPAVNGADGSQTGTASFLGNFTTITTPSGAALALGRESDCTLTLATGNYTITESTLNYTETALIPDYGRVLHSEAQLTTTPDVFASGCAIEPTAGFGSRPGIFVGMTTSGVYVYAGLGLVYPSLAEGIYLLTGTTNFSLSSFQDSTAGNLATADLNKDGNGDLVILDISVATTARVIVMLGNADGTFKNGVIYPIAGNYSVAAVIDDVNGDGKLDIVAVSGDQQISVLLGNGDGTFQAAQSFAAPSLPGYTSAASTPIVNLITADLRGIGKKDIICSNGLVLLGNGNGTFTAVARRLFPTSRTPLCRRAESCQRRREQRRQNRPRCQQQRQHFHLARKRRRHLHSRPELRDHQFGWLHFSQRSRRRRQCRYFCRPGRRRSSTAATRAPRPRLRADGQRQRHASRARRKSASANTRETTSRDVTGSGTLDLITNTVNTPYGYPDTAVPAFTVQLGTGKGTLNPVQPPLLRPPLSF